MKAFSGRLIRFGSFRGNTGCPTFLGARFALVVLRAEREGGGDEASQTVDDGE